VYNTDGFVSSCLYGMCRLTGEEFAKFGPYVSQGSPVNMGQIQKGQGLVVV
jgi:hypothetical protein